ncbi:MAG: heme A synthase [Acidimicrobiales bacterium]|nr:heme A synthase [Acidimicrobiales bacterium]
MGRRLTPEAYRRITAIAVAALSVIIVTGAAVRLTGSGLGCSDWPRCEEDRFVADAGDAHAMVEFVNRMITGVVSVAVIAAVLGSLARAPRRRDLTWWSLGLVAGVLGQIVLGGIVVLTHLTPEMVMAHFLLSMVLVWNGIVLHHRAALPDPAPERSLPSVLNRARVISAVACVAVFTGTMVTASGPHGGDEEVDRLGFDVPDIARVHGITVMVLLALAISLVVHLRRTAAPADLRAHAGVLLGVLVAQAAIGYIQYFTDVPVVLVGTHVAGATALFIAVVWFHLRVRHPAPVRTLALFVEPEPALAAT